MARVAHLQRLFLVHSFLYYKLNESIIPDHQYDSICRELQQYSPQAGTYGSLCSPLDSSGSGYYIKEYPPEIVSTALRVLWYARGRTEGFDRFVRRYGYRILKEEVTDENCPRGQRSNPEA